MWAAVGSCCSGDHTNISAVPVLLRVARTTRSTCRQLVRRCRAAREGGILFRAWRPAAVAGQPVPAQHTVLTREPSRQAVSHFVHHLLYSPHLRQVESATVSLLCKGCVAAVAFAGCRVCGLMPVHGTLPLAAAHTTQRQVHTHAPSTRTHIAFELVTVATGTAVCVWHLIPAPGADGATLSRDCS
jgi:hypothetical protein